MPPVFEPLPTDPPSLPWREGPPSEADAYERRGRPFLAEVSTPRGPELVLGEFGVVGDFDAHEIDVILRWLPLVP